MAGDTSNVWFDKCFTMISFHDGWTGFNVEHSGIDAMVFITGQEYARVNDIYDGTDVFKTATPRTLPEPKQYELSSYIGSAVQCT